MGTKLPHVCPEETQSSAHVQMEITLVNTRWALCNLICEELLL